MADQNAITKAADVVANMTIIPPEERMFIVHDKSTGQAYDIRQFKPPQQTFKIQPNKMWEQYYKFIEDQGERLRQMAEDGNLSIIMDLFTKETIVPYINKPNIEGWTALHFAANEGFEKICDYLISQEAGVNIKCNDGRTPLHLACVVGNEEVIKLLIQKSANINDTNKDLNTPTHLLSKFGHINALKLMLTYTPNLEMLNKEKLNAIEMAKDSEIVGVFKAAIDANLFKKLTSKSNNKLLQTEDTVRVSECKPQIKLKVKDFDFYKKLGKGSFGEVFLVKKKGNPKFYAMKVLDKHQVQKINLARYVITEKNVMAQYFHPFICSLEFSFQSSEKLFLVMRYCAAGDLNKLLLREKGHRITEERARLYASEVLIAIESLHSRNIIYRDLKPENVLIDENGHCVLTDFGLSKEGVTEDQVNKSFCGSVAYLAPEVLKKQGHTQSVDWYNFGTLIYEMLESRPPYFADNRDQIYKNILKQPLTFSPTLSAEVKELLTGLLQRDPKKRLSNGDDIRASKWFKKIDWSEVEERKLPVPKPQIVAITKGPMAPPMELEDSEEQDPHNMVKWTYMRTDDLKGSVKK